MWAKACGVLAAAAAASARDDGLARTPPMGWRSWNSMMGDVSQGRILAQAAALAKSYPDLGPSLRDVGYTDVGIDDEWQACGLGVNGTFHDAKGRPIWNKAIFPDPPQMVADAKAKYGLTVGWYSNNCRCHERQGHDWPWNGGGHVLQDAVATAQVGFKGMKVDSCGPALNMTEWGAQLRAADPDIVIEDCLSKGFWANGLEPIVPTAEILKTCPMHFFRTTSDVAPEFYSMLANVNQQEILLTPYYEDATRAPRPGCWSYPDMLEVGVTHGDFAMSLVESRTHFALWCVMSSPLILGFDLTNETVYRNVYPIITNARALAVNKAWAGNSGRLMKNSTDTFVFAPHHGAPAHPGRPLVFSAFQIFAKPLNVARTRWAVLVLNADKHARTVPFAPADVSSALGGAPSATDVWTGRPVDLSRGAFSLAAHDAMFMTLEAQDEVQEGDPTAARAHGAGKGSVHTLNVKALYGGVTPEALQMAITAAQKKRASLSEGDEVRVEIDAGVWDVADVAAAALMDVGKTKAAVDAWLTVAGAGMEVTTLVTGGVKPDITGRGVQRVRFANLTFQRAHNVTTSQGVVTATDAAAGTVTLRLDDGYPTPQAIYDNSTSSQPRYMRRYVLNATTGNCDLVVDDNHQVMWNVTRQAGVDPRVWVLQTTRGDITGYTVGSKVGVKSKHEAQSYYIVGGDAVEFLSVRFLGHSRGKIRSGVSNIKFEDCVVAKLVPSQCLATNGGGPQLGSGDAVSYNVSVVRHTSRNTGDDSVAFFNVGSGAVRDSYIADSFARGILLNNCSGIALEGNTLVRNPLLRK